MTMRRPSSLTALALTPFLHFIPQSINSLVLLDHSISTRAPRAVSHELHQAMHDDTTASKAAFPQVSRRNFLVATSASVVAGLTMTTTSDEVEAAQEGAISSSSESLADSVGFSASATTTSVPVDLVSILRTAGKKALGGGKAGAAAAVVQVFSLMWLRTSMNYQYRYGGDLGSSLKTLWEQGGIPRLYQGLPFALIQGPATRFGDTAANVGIFALLDTLESTHNLPLPLKTACGSAAAGLWRIFLMPIDASKTAMQVEGAAGLEQLLSQVRDKGPGPLYRGALAQAAATAVGHFPWFVTYNFLNERLPMVSTDDDLLLALLRSASLGLAASCVSDCTSNSLRVVKTTKQTAQLNMPDGKDPSYAEVVAMIIEKDGIIGFLGRGLQTRLLTNCIQGAAFSVLWKYFQEMGAMQG